MNTSLILGDTILKEHVLKVIKELNEKSVVVLPLLMEDCDIPPLIADKNMQILGSYEAGLMELLKRFAS